MSKDKVRVVFRVYKAGDIIALFPDIDEGRGLISCYMHVGQHGSVSYAGVIRSTKPASEKQYAELHKELSSIGYDLTVRKRK